MDWLLIATGFTGALTLVWLIRLAHRTFWTLPSLEAFVCPAGTGFEVTLPHLQLARREVVVLASGLARPAFAQALVDVRLKRKVNVEVLLAPDSEADPTSNLPFLLEQGLRPLVDPEHDPACGTVVIIDRRTVLTGSFLLGPPTGEGSGEETVLVIKGQPAIARLLLQAFNTHKAHARLAEARPAAPPATVTPAPAPLPPMIPPAPVLPPEPAFVPAPPPATVEPPALSQQERIAAEEEEGEEESSAPIFPFPAAAETPVCPPEPEADPEPESATTAAFSAPPAPEEREDLGEDLLDAFAPGRLPLTGLDAWQPAGGVREQEGEDRSEEAESDEGDPPGSDDSSAPQEPAPGSSDGEDFIPLRTAEILASLRRRLGEEGPAEAV